MLSEDGIRKTVAMTANRAKQPKLAFVLANFELASSHALLSTGIQAIQSTI